MITGFNTDVDFSGKVFHVQTEDRGIQNPVVESLVYTGGRIITARKNSYAELVEAGKCNESVVLQRMETQHRDLIREIRNGEFSKEELKPFGHGIVTNRSFDEVVRCFLLEHFALTGLELNVEPAELWAGDKTTLKVKVEDGKRPIVGATVVISLVTSGSPVTELLSAQTDKMGWIQAACEMPIPLSAGASIIFEADAMGSKTRLERPLQRRAAARA